MQLIRTDKKNVFDSPDIYGIRVETSKPYLLIYIETAYLIYTSIISDDDNFSICEFDNFRIEKGEFIAIIY